MNPELLLHPNIPKPLHGLNPRTIKGDAWWNVQRQLCYQKAGYCCEACGVSKHNALFHKWLEAHEYYDIDYAKGTATFVKLVALCHACHNYIHSGRLRVLHDKGQITTKKYLTILKHGEQLTKGLVSPVVGKCAPWESWKLVFEDKEYKSTFANFEDWNIKYNPSIHSITEKQLDS